MTEKQYGSPIQVRRNYRKQFDKIINRVQNKKACGIIYNVPPVFSSVITNRLLDEGKHIAIDARSAYTYDMLFFRLSRYLKIPKIKAAMLPAALEGKILTITNADFITNNYARVMEDCSKNNIPLLLLFRTQEPLDSIRKFHSYNRILTIEQDYSEFLITKN